MSTWSDVERESPELAAAVLARFQAAKHHVLATLRADGSPRVSGTEVGLADGELYVGSMAGAAKARDLLRDPRFALHAHTGDGSMRDGDAKVAGRALAVTDDVRRTAVLGAGHAAAGAHLFFLRLEEAVLTAVDGDELVVRWWRPGQEVREVRRQ